MNSIRNNKGLTLVEILITLAVLGIVIMPLMSMFITSQRMNNESEMKYKAIQFAQEELETIKAMKELDTSVYPLRAGGGYGYLTAADSEGYTIDVKIEKGHDFGGSDIGPIDIPENYDRPVYNIYDEEELQIDIAAGIEKIGIKINIPYVAEAKIRLIGSNENVKVYVFNENKEQNTYRIIGDSTVIEIAEDSAKPDNELYDIAVTVERNGDLIDIIEGTTVFEISPD